MLSLIIPPSIKEKKKDKRFGKDISFSDFLKQYRGDISYDNEYSYLRQPINEILNGVSEVNICKGSQVGASEMLISLTFYLMMQRSKNIFYLLPTASDASDFSAARFNTVIESNEQIREKFNYDNVGHKRCKNSNLYVRGSNSIARLKSVPVSILIIDERDEIPEENAEIVYERLSGSKEKQIINISTPTLPDRGIWRLTRDNNEYNFYISCIYCHYLQIISMDNIDLSKGAYKCVNCKKTWTQEQKTQMIINAVNQQEKDKNCKVGWQLKGEKKDRGIFFHIPQFLSPTVTAFEIAKKHKESTTEMQKQVFYNHKLGLPYVAEGTKLTKDLVDNKVDHFETSSFVRVAGIDVSQSNMHYCVVISVVANVGIAVEDCFRVSWENMKNELNKRDVVGVVIDANPERHSAREFLRGWESEGALALYPNGMKELFEVVERETKYVKIARTEILDIILDRFRSDTILIQKNFAHQGEYKNFKTHLCNIVRSYREIRGQIEAYYTEVGDDHYAHALAYAEVASRMIFGIEVGQETVIEGSFV